MRDEASASFMFNIGLMLSKSTTHRHAFIKIYAEFSLFITFQGERRHKLVLSVERLGAVGGSLSADKDAEAQLTDREVSCNQ